MMMIGDVARRAGVRPSTIRYYEKQGLIPMAPRRAGRRIYDRDVLDHLLFVRTALRSGFRVSEIRGLVEGLTVNSKPGERWRAVAETKLGELDREIASLEAKKRLLKNLVKCRCSSLSAFAEAVAT